MRVVSGLKSLLVSPGERPRRVPTGLYADLTFEIDLASHTQIYLGLWERETHRWLRLAAGRCAWAVDVGAGRGELSLYLLKHSAATVYAFEPQARELDAFRRHLALNDMGATSRLVLSSRLVGTAPSESTVALDTLPVDRRARGFVKVDVDGAEMDVLGSASKLLADAAVDILVETHTRQLEEDCLAFLRARGYACRVIPNAWWRVAVPELRPVPHNRWLWAERP